MSDETGRVALARGRLDWDRDERITDRYGSVVIERGAIGPNSTRDYDPFERAPVGTYGRLIAEVIETRESYSRGDFFRGINPTRPEAGESIVLGEGTLFRAARSWAMTVGLLPVEWRETDWLDPEALYRAHNQTVRLVFEPVELP